MSENIFGFLSDTNNYLERVVGRYPEEGEFLVDTAKVSDGKQPYETAVAHPYFNEGKVVIVEAYPTKKAANKGHKKWVNIMTADELPKELVDCCNAHIADLCNLKPYPKIVV
uniref:Uncharacterized protein n=1 Tax=viral metagenome TaxID=1070528 RepID=A0A6H1ZH70_9ZZZZ